MNTFLLTLILSIILILLCLLGLGISFWLTGKNRLRGSCGGIKNFLTSQGEKQDCPICGSDEKCKDK